MELVWEVYGTARLIAIQRGVSDFYSFQSWDVDLLNNFWQMGEEEVLPIRYSAMQYFLQCFF